ncbi:hypothetical protein [Martelella endophytica]|uniref:Uncharacterized protein n=1 Tax=Martelella endophytica TaxID=1486262 RepID=A0A0D5LSX2_MAREN|nr:hypothetical protein [Martelella endophytica]AJY47065.1 hypothetical protein TM49_17520 [Martelella endophytica]
MLQIPQYGFQRSVNKSNVDRIPLGDWLEGIVLFDQKEVTKSEVVDALIEYQICPDEAQDLAHDIASDGWDELRQRRAWGGLPESTTISTNRLEENVAWEAQPVRSFFLLLSLFQIFPDWAKDVRDNVTQGNLFEEVVELICPAILPGWNVFRAGWSPENAKSVPDIVAELCEKLFVNGATNMDDWHAPDAKDGGLDIVCYRSFADQREAMPVYFLQCASGKNWRNKVNTPNADLWQKLLDAAVRPSTGIAAPFVIGNRELKIAGLTGQITVLDRLRLLGSATVAGTEFPEDLTERLVKWMRDRIGSLPRAT